VEDAGNSYIVFIVEKSPRNGGNFLSYSNVTRVPRSMTEENATSPLPSPPRSLVSRVPFERCGGLGWYRPVASPRSEHTWRRFPNCRTILLISVDGSGLQYHWQLNLISILTIMSTCRGNRIGTLHTKINRPNANNWYSTGFSLRSFRLYFFIKRIHCDVYAAIRFVATNFGTLCTPHGVESYQLTLVSPDCSPGL
jgi:hypothetical protein